MSQRMLAKLLNKPPSYVNKCESGERQLNIVELREWCRAIGKPLTELVQQFEEAAEQSEQ